jgi:outer membrane protein TolC
MSEKIQKRVLIAAGLFCLWLPVFSAEAASETSTSLPDLIQKAQEKNAALRAKKEAYEASRSRVVEAWFPDDPRIGVDVEGQSSLFSFGSRTDNEYMVEQTIPFPSKLFLKGVIASKETAGRFEQYKEEQRNLVWHLEQPYYELYLLKKTREVLEDNRRLLEQLAQSARARYESNQAPQADLLRAQIELSKNSIEIFNALQKEHLAQAHFSHILNESFEKEYAVISAPELREALPYSRAEFEKLAVQKRPELKALEIAVERAKANQSLAHSNWLPDITGRIEARQFQGESGTREKDTFIGFSVPVWSLLKGAGGGWESSDHEVKEAEAVYLQMKNETLLKVHEAFSKVQSAENSLTIYENSILPQAKQEVEVALSSYEAGRVDFQALMDSQKILKEAQLDYYKSWAEYWKGFSDLRLAVGGDWVKGGKVS